MMLSNEIDPGRTSEIPIIPSQHLRKWRMEDRKITPKALRPEPNPPLGQGNQPICHCDAREASRSNLNVDTISTLLDFLGSDPKCSKLTF